MGFRRYAGGAGLAKRAPRGMVRALIAAAALALGGWAGPPSGWAQAQTGARALEHHATVLNGRTVGSAFLIDDDLALTNAHVIEGLSPGQSVRLVASTRRAEVTAEVIAISPRMDLALLRAPEGFLPVVSGIDASREAGLAVVGAGVDASGGRGPGQRLELSGAILTPHTDLHAYGPGLVVAMPGVRPGFSGGPVLDGGGRLVGMITAIRSSGAGRAARASGGSLVAKRLPDEAFVLRAAEIRREAMRLLRAAGG